MENQYNPDIHHRRSIRLQGYDYAQVAAYFVTICTLNRQYFFGEVIDGEMWLNDQGRIVEEEWAQTAVVRPNVVLDAFVVMPNHVHGIVVIQNDPDTIVGAQRAVPLQRPIRQFGTMAPGSLPAIVRSFKSAVTKRINEMRETPGISIWQRNYYERIIRNAHELDRVREYITNNPMHWAEDENNRMNM